MLHIVAQFCWEADMDQEATPFARYMKRAFETPGVERWQTRFRRRCLVAAFPVLLALAIGLPWATGVDWLAVILAAAFLVLASFLNMSVRGITSVPSSVLDERQRLLAARSHMHAFYPALTAAFLFMVFVYPAVQTLPLAQGVVLPALFFGTLAALPGMILAWRLPDEPAE
jgi:hypothetical protein